MSCHNSTHSNHSPPLSVQESTSLSGSSNLLLLSRLISRRQVRLGRSRDTNTLLGKARAVHGAIEALLDMVPAHDALEMGAEGAELFDVSVLVLVNGDGLLGVGLFYCSLAQAFKGKS